MGPNVWEPYQALPQSSSTRALLRVLRRTAVWGMDITLSVRIRGSSVLQVLRQIASRPYRTPPKAPVSSGCSRVPTAPSKLVPAKAPKT